MPSLIFDATRPEGVRPASAPSADVHNSQFRHHSVRYFIVSRTLPMMSDKIPEPGRPPSAFGRYARDGRGQERDRKDKLRCSLRVRNSRVAPAAHRRAAREGLCPHLPVIPSGRSLSRRDVLLWNAARRLTRLVNHASPAVPGTPRPSAEGRGLSRRRRPGRWRRRSPKSSSRRH